MEYSRYVFLKSVEETCAGCPTLYKGVTVDNEDLFFRLRHGYMYAELNGELLFDANPPDLDGVCVFEDVKRYATTNGVLIMEV